MNCPIRKGQKKDARGDRGRVDIRTGKEGVGGGGGREGSVFPLNYVSLGVEGRVGYVQRVTCSKRPSVSSSWRGGANGSGKQKFRTQTEL